MVVLRMDRSPVFSSALRCLIYMGFVLSMSKERSKLENGDYPHLEQNYHSPKIVVNPCHYRAQGDSPSFADIY
jgi:hypothetical protein